MTTTKESICSSALIRLGAKPISSFTDGTDRATACANIYSFVKDMILSLYDWRFTVKKRQLSRQDATPTTKWTYQYTLPSDRLTDGVIALYNSNVVGAAPIKDFEINMDGLLCDETTVYIDYQGENTSEANWPAYFVELMIRAMMVELCFTVTDNAGQREGLKDEVYGNKTEYPNGGLVRACRTRNAGEDPPVVFGDFTLIEARFGGV